MNNKSTCRLLRTGVFFLCALLLSLGPLQGPVSAANPARTENTGIQSRYEAHEALNALRKHLGLSTLTMSAELNLSAQNHAIYMDAVGSTDPVETQNAYYTGTFPMDRARYAGFTKGPVMEMSTTDVRDFSEMIRELFQNPQYRYYFLSPEYDSIGYGLKDGYADILLGSGRSGPQQKLMVSYPYASEQSVGNVAVSSLSFAPDSVRAISSRLSIGEVISCAYFTEKMNGLSFVNATFTLKDTRQDREVPCSQIAVHDRITLTGLEGMRNVLLFYPLQPYNANTRYEASLSCEVWQDGEMIDQIENTWSFTSAGPDSIGEVNRMDALNMLCDALELDWDSSELKPDFLFQDYYYNSHDKSSRRIYGLLKEGIISRERDGSIIRLYSSATREQTAYWLMEFLRRHETSLYYSVPLTYGETFEDINSVQRMFRTSVQRAKLLGIVDDQGGGTFAPGMYITRNEMNTWILNMQTLIEDYHANHPDKT